jgi:hypothetical protein
MSAIAAPHREADHAKVREFVEALRALGSCRAIFPKHIFEL